MPMKYLAPFAFALAVALPCGAALAADPVGIGMITTLSGPGGYLGEETRDGFQLAIDEGQGKLGGVPVRLLVEDDGLKPVKGKEIAGRYLKRDDIKIFTGIVFANVLLAAAPDILDAGAFYVGSVTGPSVYAGKQCDKNLFIASFQTDSVAESAGQLATNLGYKKMATIAVNYQAGKDALDGFKRYYKGKIVSELFTRLDQTDFAAEIAQIRAARPDAVFEFLPGGFGITFLKQYAQAGLKDTIPLVLSHASMEQRIIAAVGDAALGVYSSSYWSPDLDNPASKAFVAAFEAKYHRTPTFYAATAYDAARLIGSGLAAVHGDMAKADAYRAALEKADFASVRGSFKFAHNHFPIEDWLALRVERDGDGHLVNRIFGKVFTAHADPFGDQCKM